jgi:hypothetical protein
LYEWKSYSKPSLWSSLGKDGTNGTPEEVQGLAGPVIRFKGDYDPAVEYVNMKNALDSELGLTGIRYIDIVKYTDSFYYMVLPIETGDGIRRVTGIAPTDTT